MILKNQLHGLIYFPLVSLFIATLFLKTFYEIKGKKLIVRSNLILTQYIDIQSINKISKSRSWVSAPALSMDRLEINYGKFDSVIISPENKEEFIMNLLEINPNIEVVY